MEKHIDSRTVATDWDRVLLDVAQDDNTIIIEQDGDPIAVLLPLQAYHRLHRAQETDPNETTRHQHAWPKRDIRDETAD
jgi:antitoxin (DNA-binding transcriptional repressor) of toxin-antitoxin stability system